MSRLTITSDALRELRERMARSKWPLGISIVGPLDYDVRAPESPEEAWAVQKLYGPLQRWVLNLVPVAVLGDVTRQGFYVEEVSGISVRVLAPAPVPHLCVELQGDTIRVYEVDAHLSLNPDAPRLRFAPSVVAPVSLGR
jgi:hypothetical protein